MSYLPLITDEPDRMADLARNLLAATDAVGFDELAGPEQLPARLMPVDVRDAMTLRRQGFDDLAKALEGGAIDQGWLAREAVIDGAMASALCAEVTDDGATLGRVETAAAMARAVEDVTELEREAWCRWMRVTGALLGGELARCGSVDAIDVRQALATASDAVDEQQAITAIMRR